jgi:polyisoprenyl-teichoic acid--peptidoglycan teichoic acid transferase
MADGQKPYRLYRGGRTKGKVPSLTRPGSAPPGGNGPGAAPYRGPGPKPKRRRLTRGRIAGLVVVLLVLLLALWAVTGYLTFRSGVSAANRRLPNGTRAALTKQSGLLMSKPTDILLLGTDHADTQARSADEHSDSIMLVRSDPKHHRVVFLSIARDLRVSIPGHGEDKINAAFQIGGAPLAIRTVRDFTGLPVNHVALVDFASFQSLIDEIGGVDIDVPEPILSNRFDCPYSTETRCLQWPGWRFAKGKQHMDGRHALVYSRIRENRLNPRESDVTRGARQQQVLQAIEDKIAGPGTLARMPFIGGDLLKPLATDLTAAQFLQLGWVKFRGHTLHCRLGGIPTDIGGGSYLQPDEEARSVIQMVKGTSAPQPPLPGSLYGSGCLIGAG